MQAWMLCLHMSINALQGMVGHGAVQAGTPRPVRR